MKMKARNGFTLVELLIVVVVLGILAAIVIPQFSDASSDAKLNRLLTDLQTMRSQIELYKIQHNGALPGAGTATFTDAMTDQTDVAGAAGTDYGPYVRQIPTNPFNDLADIDEEAGVTLLGSDNKGWHFNTSTGAFSADTDAHTSY